MNKSWQKVILQILNNPQQVNKIKCPNCSKCGIDYIYVGEKESRIGYLQVWCNECLKGSYVSRVKAPENVKFAIAGEELEGIIPAYEYI